MTTREEHITRSLRHEIERAASYMGVDAKRVHLDPTDSGARWCAWLESARGEGLRTGYAAHTAPTPREALDALCDDVNGAGDPEPPEGWE